MKKLNFLSGFIAGAVLFGSISVVSAKTEKIEALFDNIKIKINGKIIDTGEDKPFIYAGRTYLPVRYVAEAFNSTVKWNESDNTVEIDSVASPSVAPGASTTSVTPKVTGDSSKTYTPYEKDGYEVINVDGVEYIGLAEIQKKHHLYGFKWIIGNKSSFIKVGTPSEESKSYTVLIKEVTTTFITDANYIEYNFFINTMKPLIN